MMRCLVELDQRINHFRSVQLSGFRVFDGPRRDRVERRAFQVFGTSNVAGVPHVRPDFSSCVPCRADGRIESCVAAGLAVSWQYRACSVDCVCSSGRVWTRLAGRHRQRGDVLRFEEASSAHSREGRRLTIGWSSAADAVLHGLDGGVLVYTLGRQHGECAHQVVESVGLGRFAR